MKKLGVLVVTVVIIILAVRLWTDRADTAHVDPAQTGSAVPNVTAATTPIPATTPAPSATTKARPGPYGGTAEARRQWEPIVQGFALAYPDTAGLSRKEWLANLRPYIDRPVFDALSITDLDKVPHGHYAGYQPLKVADEAITIRVTYQEGWALDLHLASTGRSWSVSRFDVAADFD
jgi:hypothetical protein